MRAVRYHDHGGPETLTVDEVDQPEPGEGEVLVKIEAASLNPIDTYLRDGNLSPAGGLPHIGGSDMAGVVDTVGDGVEAFEPGQRVFATGLGIFSQGTYAEYTVAPADMLAPLPDDVSFHDGAAAAMAFATAWRGLITRGDLEVGEVALVQGASGGVGHAAVQVADAAGAHVIGVAREGEPADFARELGADAVVDYRREKMADELRQAAGGREIDVVLESHADSQIASDLETLARGGRIVIIGEEGPIEITPPVSMTGKQADADLRFMSLAASPDDQAPILERVGPLLADGTFTVEIDSVYSLEEATAAQQRLMSSGVLGKVLLDPTK